MNDRLVGIDLARSFALLGMCVVHFILVAGMSGSTDGDFFSGRPAALFVVLAGVGVTLLTRRAVKSGDLDLLRSSRSTLIKRGIFLLGLGFFNLVIWPGDILRVYGVTLIAVAWLIDRPAWWLLVATGGCVVTFLVLLGCLDFEQNWDWSTLEYRNLWSTSGLIRNLFYDGFRTVFPWAGFLLFGMWLGRLDLTERRTKYRLVILGIMLFVAVEITSHLLVRYFTEHPGSLRKTDIDALFGTGSLPPMPFFLLSSGSSAVAVLGICLMLGDGAFVRVLAAPGRLALTWYLLHIIVGLGGVFALGWTQSFSPIPAAVLGFIFWLGSIVVSVIYLSYFRIGPAETLMRKLTG